MQYPHFRAQHLFVGSGVIEAGCKTVIGSRLKQSGMFTVDGANSIIALNRISVAFDITMKVSVILPVRCSHLNGRFEDYREGRRAA